MITSLVTGGAGFIGSVLTQKLLHLGHKVIVIDNESSDAHEQFYWNKRAENHKLDIRDYNSTRPLYDGVDYVFHLAAEARIQPSIINPIEATSNNVIGTITVLQCSREARVKRLMYSSTSSAYGLNKTPNVETQFDDRLNPYSVSKVAGEKICSMYYKLFGLPTIIFRYFNVYGEHQPIRGQYSPVIGIFMRQKENNQPLTIVGDGEQKRDFVNVYDVVDANILASQTSDNFNFFGEVFNVGSGKSYTINQIASLISDKKIYVPSRKGEAKETLADITKINKILGWSPKVNLEKWIKENLLELPRC